MRNRTRCRLAGKDRNTRNDDHQQTKIRQQQRQDQQWTKTGRAGPPHRFFGCLFLYQDYPPSQRGSKYKDTVGGNRSITTPLGLDWNSVQRLRCPNEGIHVGFTPHGKTGLYPGSQAVLTWTQYTALSRVEWHSVVVKNRSSLLHSGNSDRGLEAPEGAYGILQQQVTREP